MMIWAVQDAAMTRIRVQTEPLASPWHRPWPGWERRSGEVPDELFQLAMTSTDDVEIEWAHQEMWLLLDSLD